MEKRGRGGCCERRRDSPSLKPAQGGPAVCTLTPAGEPFLPVKLSVEAVNMKHKRKAAPVGASCCVTKEGKCVGPELLPLQHAHTSPGRPVKRQMLTRRPG